MPRRETCGCCELEDAGLDVEDEAVEEPTLGAAPPLPPARLVGTLDAVAEAILGRLRNQRAGLQQSGGIG